MLVIKFGIWANLQYGYDTYLDENGWFIRINFLCFELTLGGYKW